MGDSVLTVERKGTHAGTSALAADDAIPQEELKREIKKQDIDGFYSPQASSKQNDPAHDGKFSFMQCAKNFLGGLLSPIKAMISNPIMTACMLAIPIGLSFFAGAAAIMPVVGVGFFVFGGVTAVYELGKGGYKFISSAVKGDKDGMENAFKDVGAGVSGIISTLIGARFIAKPFRNMLKLKSTDITKETNPIDFKQLIRQIKGKSVKVSRETRIRAYEIYNTEIKDMAYNLGIPEKEKALREILPKIQIKELEGAAGSVVFPACRKIQLHLDPFWLLFRSHRTIAHEVGHLEQAVFQLMHLSRKEFVKSYTEGFLVKMLSKQKSQPDRLTTYIIRFIGRILATIGWNSNIKYVQTLKTLTTQADKQRALRLIRAHSNYSNCKTAGYTAYSNDLLEIDANMREILSCLKRLDKTTSDKTTRHALKSLGVEFKNLCKKPIDPAWDEISLKIRQIKDLLGSNARALQQLSHA